MKTAVIKYTNGIDVGGSVVVPSALLVNREGIYRAVCDHVGITPTLDQSAFEAIRQAGICHFKAVIK